MLGSLPVAATHGNLVDHLVHDEGYLQLYWDTHYVSEGRDNLAGGALQTSVVSLKYDVFELFVWNGWGYDSDYNEVNIMPFIHYHYQNLSFYVSYNRLEFTEQGQTDNELGSGISYSGLAKNLYLDLDWYHSLAADGTFFELSMARLFKYKDVLRVESRAILGINSNYIPDGHDGLNHIALQVNGEYSLLTHVNLHAKLHFSHAIDRNVNQYPGDALLRNLWLGSVGLEFLF